MFCTSACSLGFSPGGYVGQCAQMGARRWGRALGWTGRKVVCCKKKCFKKGRAVKQTSFTMLVNGAIYTTAHLSCLLHYSSIKAQ